MKKAIVLLSFLLLAVTFAPVQTSAQDNPAAGIELQLVDEQGNVVGTTTTKKDGSWSFKVSSEGSYSLVMVGGLEGARMAINTKGTGANNAKKEKKATQTFTATATLSDGRTEGKTVSGLESETEVYEFKLELTSDDVSIVSPRDAASGQSSGKRVHGPLKVLKRMDKATPLLYQSVSGKSLEKIAGTVSYDLKTNTK